MALFLFRFWPVLIPLVVYWLWHIRAKRIAIKSGAPVPHFRDGPIYWAVLASLLTAVLCFLFVGLTHEENDGKYVPPRLENGTLVPGKVVP